MKRWLPLLLSTWGWVGAAQATVLVNYGFEELVHESELIVRAEVLDRYSEAPDAAHSPDIHTVVTLRVTQVLKGEVASDELTLSFLGGTVNGDVLEVSGQFIPAVGEDAVLFISDMDGHQVNPLTGWFQGYFPIQQDAGVAYLDLHERPDLILANLTPDPLLKKLLSLGMSEADVEQRFPGYARFALQDFFLAIEAEVAAEGVAP